MGLLERHGARLLWSEEHQVPYAFYSNAGVFEWLFLEDARSFRAKIDLVEEYGLLGFSAWVLGSEDPEIWQVLEPEGG
jgi:spore germination protein YaaH